MNSFRVSAIVASGAQYLMFVLSFVKIAVISRLLTPTDIGVYTIAGALIFMAQVFRVYGTWDFIVSRKEIDRHQLGLCSTVLFVMAIVVTTAFLIAAPYAADFFAMPDLTGMIQLMALSFLILPIGAINQALMNRDLRFVPLSIIRIAATLADTGLVIILIYLDFGLISLAWGYVAANVVSTVMVIFYDPKNIIFRPRLRGMTELLRFGTLSASGTLLNNIGYYAPTMLLGRAYDAATVGFYGRGQTLITFFRQGLEVATGPVTTSWFAKKAKGSLEDSRNAYVRFVIVVAAVSWPLYIFVMMNAATLIPLLLGPNWTVSVPITQVLAIGGILTPYTVAGMNLLTGRGKVGLRLWFSLINQVVRIAILLVALSYGFSAFVWGIVIAHGASLVLMALLLRREIGLSLRGLLRSMRHSAILAGVVAALNYVMLGQDFATVPVSIGYFTVVMIVTALAWVGCIVGLKHVLWEEVQRALAARRGKKAAA